MGSQHILSQDKINLISTRAGFSAKAIVEETGAAKRTVERCLKRCHKAADGVTPKHLLYLADYFPKRLQEII